MKVHKVT